MFSQLQTRKFYYSAGSLPETLLAVGILVGDEGPDWKGAWREMVDRIWRGPSPSLPPLPFLFLPPPPPYFPSLPVNPKPDVQFPKVPHEFLVCLFSFLVSNSLCFKLRRENFLDKFFRKLPSALLLLLARHPLSFGPRRPSKSLWIIFKILSWLLGKEFRTSPSGSVWEWGKQRRQDDGASGNHPEEQGSRAGCLQYWLVSDRNPNQRSVSKNTGIYWLL